MTQLDLSKNWTTGKYGGQFLTLGDGLIRASVTWCIKRGTPGWIAAIGSRTYTHVFNQVDNAKAALESKIKEQIRLALSELPE